MSAIGTANAVAKWPLSSAMPPAGALATAPGMARAHVRAVLAAWHLVHLSEAAELAVGELAANAVAASGDASGRPTYANGRMPVIRVFLLTDSTRLRAEVWDQAPGVPVLRHAASDAESGRGLALVDALTGGRWGWCRAVGQPGKCVWAEIDPSDGDSGVHATRFLP